jgi:KUP system potassium uptake protein
MILVFNQLMFANLSRVCVMFVTFFDTCMVSLAALIVWRIHPLIVFFPWLTIACLDGTYISSALTKVPDGAWFTITLATVLAMLFILWRFGKEQQWQAEAEDRFPTSHLVKVTKSGKMKLAPNYGGETLSIIKGLGIFFDKGGETTPAVFSQFVAKLIATPEVIVFFHLRPLETPTVPADKRYNVSRLAIPNCYRLIVRHGYTDEVITPDLASLVTEQVRNFIITSGAAKKLTPSDEKETDESTPSDNPDPDVPFDPLPRKSDEKSRSPHITVSPTREKPTVTITADDAEANARTDASISYDLLKLQEAYDRQVLYIIGKEQMKIKGTDSWPRQVILSVFLWIRDNTRTKIANLRVPTDRVIEVGFVKEV